ncbi:MAG: hypothetical protein WBG82_07625 [Parvibaculum sp.]|uniref:hypothetical protein n=1 Tax=Parvibaculum sp. TaxID=2024848 RepID=UPI003C7095D1
MTNQATRDFRRRFSALTLAATLLLPAAALAEEKPAERMPSPPPQGQNMPQQGERHMPPPPPQHRAEEGRKMNRTAMRREHPEFTADQSGFARDYYRRNNWEGRPLPHGQRLGVGHRLPRGVHRHPLPADLAYRFPHGHGYEAYIVGDDIVLVAVATGIIVDILSNVH